MPDWWARVRHDLVKRALWAIRDLRAAGLHPGEADRALLRAGLLDLVDEEGRPASASQLWSAFRAEAPAELPAAALDAVEVALAEAEARAQDPAADIASLAAALGALEERFEALALLLPQNHARRS